MNEIYTQTLSLTRELLEKAGLKPGQILVVGCSTSEVLGERIGSNSSPETAGEIFRGLADAARERGIHLAIQCCEHLNRAIVTERAAAPGCDEVNVIPQPKAGGSLATCAWHSFSDPVALESIKADAGLDIGLTLIGMHLKPVAVPLRLSKNKLGEALIVAARTRPKFIGGARAAYDQKKL